MERVAFPDAFHLAHYMVCKLTHLIRDLRVYPENMMHNIEKTGGLLFSQSVLGQLLAQGLERQHAYKLVQRNAMRVWDGAAPSLREALEQDPDVKASFSNDARALAGALDRAFDLASYTQHVDALFQRAGIGR